MWRRLASLSLHSIIVLEWHLWQQESNMKKFNTIFIGTLVMITAMVFDHFGLMAGGMWDVHSSAFIGLAGGIIYLVRTYGVQMGIYKFMVGSFQPVIAVIAFGGMFHPLGIFATLLGIHILNVVIGFIHAVNKVKLDGDIENKDQIVEMFEEG